jgi:hypothetical protein
MSDERWQRRVWVILLWWMAVNALCVAGIAAGEWQCWINLALNGAVGWAEFPQLAEESVQRSVPTAINDELDWEW